MAKDYRKGRREGRSMRIYNDDYLRVAHIGRNRTIAWAKGVTVSTEQRRAIEIANPTSSVTQPYPGF